MKALLRTQCSNEYIETFPDVLVVDITPALLKMRERLKDVSYIPGFYCLEVFDSLPTLSYFDDLEAAGLVTDKDSYLIWSGNTVLKSMAEEPPEAGDFRVDCPTIQLLQNGVQWQWHQRHNGRDTFTSSILHWGTIEKSLKTSLHWGTIEKALKTS